MSVHLFGIRHHGPGCARSLTLALEQLQPDLVLVEGPPDAQDVLPLLMHEAMQPPVALLIYAQDNPQQAVYYPFAQFSPEWQALRYALQRNLPARFIDLPQSIQFASAPQPQEPELMNSAGRDRLIASAPSHLQQTTGRDRLIASAPSHLRDTELYADAINRSLPEQEMPDPFALLAQAVGYDDYELWWELQIEQRHDMTDLFDGILEAMTVLRADLTPRDEHEAQREAHMRQKIHDAQKEGFQRIAVVCGAWHTPAMLNLETASDDAALLRGLKRTKVTATWIPWTNSRLSYRSGYGAGITSPGWYEHLWHYDQGITERWITRAAHLLRTEGLDASSASVIEAIRLSETLAALRDLPMPGLAEHHEAIQTVLCHGDASPMNLIREQLEIGERLGSVPDETPTIPLQRDLESQQRKLRLKPSLESTTLDLDIREETGRARSQLLHRLHLLGIPWGKVQTVRGKSGTFHEFWRLRWQVEFIIALIEKNIWGNTIEIAASAFARHLAETAQELPQLTALLDAVILADLTGTVDYLLHQVQQRAAVSSDVRHLMDALPPLARVARYSNVRQTKAEHILPVLDGLFERILVGLPTACSSLDDDAAQAMVGSINHVQESINLLNRDEQRTAWQAMLRRLLNIDDIHGLVRGRCCRLLLEQQALDEEELQRLAALALSPVNPSPQAAAWIEGVLRGSGLLLLHQNGLWRVLDQWLITLSADVFDALLPFLRRAFSEFQAPERRAMGEKVKHLSTQEHRQSQQNGSLPINQERAALVLPTLAHILGVQYDANNAN